MEKVKSSRVLNLEKELSILGYKDSLRAFDLVLREMGRDNGFERHDGSHYYYHLVDVTQILLNFGVRDEDIITAALLHDFIEDVEWATFDYVDEMYGKRVANLVNTLSKKDGVNYKEDREEMRKYLDGIESSYETSLIKTADRIHNFSSMKNSTTKHRMNQVRETREVYIPFFKRCRKKYVRYSNFFFFAKTTIEPLLYEIENSTKIIGYLEEEIKQLKERGNK